MKNNLNVEFRIGISTTVLNCKDGNKPLDGIGVYTRSIFNELQMAGFTPQGYAFPPLYAPNLCKGFPSSFKALALKGLLPFTKPLAMPVDIFHVTDYRAVPMTCPVVTTLYDAIPFVDPGLANSRLRTLKNCFLRRSAEYADHVIAISNYSVRELVEHYKVPESKISVVYCGVDDDWLGELPTKENIDQVLFAHNLKPGYFLTVGTLQPRKNILRLLQAHSRLPAALRKAHPVVVVGRRGWNCDALVAQLDEKIIQGEARWLANIDSREDLRCLYAGAEAFLFPSLYEGFGLPVLEAFAMGLPVLTSNTTSLPEVSNGIAVEVNPLSLVELSEGMLHLLNLPDRTKIIAAGKERARELSWARCADETLKVYRKVLKASH